MKYYKNIVFMSFLFVFMISCTFFIKVNAVEQYANYAIVYSDGTLVFQNGNTTDATHGTVLQKYTNFLQEKYNEYDSIIIPWDYYRLNITTVEFKDVTKPLSMKQWFWYMSGLTELKNVENLDLSECKSLQGTFAYTNIEELNLSNKNTSKLVNLESTFSECKNLKSLNLNNWDVSNVTTLNGTFHNCLELTDLNLIGWNPSKCTDLSNTFRNCYNLEILDLNNWNTENVEKLYYTFCVDMSYTSHLKVLNIGNWKTPKLTFFTNFITGQDLLEELDLSNLDTRNSETDGGSIYLKGKNLRKIILGPNFDLKGKNYYKGNFWAPSASDLEGADGVWHSKGPDGEWNTEDDYDGFKSIIPNDTFYSIKPILTFNIIFKNGNEVVQELEKPLNSKLVSLLIEKEGYILEGWLKSDGTLWDFEKDKVIEDVELIAKWVARNDCPVTIKKYIQKANYNEENDYEDVNIKYFSDGVFNEEYVVIPEEKEGYVINIEKSKLRIESVGLTNNIIEIYYDRRKINVNFKDSFTKDLIIQEVRYNSKVNEIDGGLKSEFVFNGWYKEDTDELFDFENTLITDDITLYSKWLLSEDIGLSGVVKENESPIAYAHAIIKQGNTIYKDTWTDAEGKYSMTQLLDGAYNLVVEKDNTISTSIIYVNTNSSESSEIDVVTEGINSVLTVNEGTKDVVIGGINELYKDTTLFSEEDNNAIIAGGSVTYSMNVTSVTQNEIEERSADLIDKVKEDNKEISGFLTMFVEKQRVIPGEIPQVEQLSDLNNNLLEIHVPLREDQQGKEGYIVYRMHDGIVSEITETPNENGAYMTLIDGNNNGKTDELVVYASKFSDYCLAYDKPKYTVTINYDNGIESSVYSVTEDTRIVKPENPIKDGYTFSKWVIKGTEIEFDFNTPITESIEIIAVYTKNQSSGGNSSGSGSSSGGSSSGINRPFIDVKRKDWYYEDVYKAYDKGLIDGIDKKTFNPNGNMDRASTAHIFYVLNNVKDYKYKDVFNDVAKDTKYMKDILWVNDNNIMIGYGYPWLGSFGPRDSLTREQFALILYRVYKKDIDKYNWSEEMIEESKKVSDWALESMCWAVSKNIIKGNENGDLMPQKAISRAEACTIIIRLLKE